MARGPSAAASTDLGSFRLGNCTFGKLSPRKLPLGCCRLRKSLWESTYYLSPSPSLCLLSPSFLSPHPLFPVSASPLSCFLITSFLFCLLIQSFLSPHPLFTVSSSPLFCLLITSFLSPHPIPIYSFLFPHHLFPVSSNSFFLFHHLLLSVHSFTYSYSLYPLPFFLYHPFFPVSLSLFPESTSALSCLHFRSSYFFIHFFQTLFPFPIF